MGFEVKLYSFSKRDNSTDRPETEIITATGNLKAGCGILNPTIEFNFEEKSPANYPVGEKHKKLNYAYIYQFGQRYYFVREWTWEAGLWTAHMEVDVLATYKENIGDSTLYVLRASNARDGTITDLLYPAKTGCSYYSSTHNSPWILDTGACFCCGIVTPTGAYGGVSYFLLGFKTMENLCEAIIDNNMVRNNNLTWQGLSDGLVLSLVNPLQYIKSCVMLPIDLGDIVAKFPVLNMKVFNWPTGVSGWYTQPDSDVIIKKTFNINPHPLAESRGSYLNAAPFTSLTLTIPPFGCIDVDTSVTCGASSLTASVSLDIITGKGVLTVSCHGIVLNRIEAQVGVPISLSQVTRDYVGAATSAAGAIGSVVGGFTGGGIGNAITGAASGIGNAIESMMPRASTVGTTGAFAMNKGTWRLDHQYFTPVDDDNAHNGRPLCAMRNLGALGGYQLIQDGDVRTTGTKEEDEKIRAYLEGGYYYE